MLPEFYLEVLCQWVIPWFLSDGSLINLMLHEFYLKFLCLGSSLIGFITYNKIGSNLVNGYGVELCTPCELLTTHMGTPNVKSYVWLWVSTSYLWLEKCNICGWVIPKVEWECAPWCMDGGWTRNTFQLGLSSLANHGKQPTHWSIS
jgi:hypothetical protein